MGFFSLLEVASMPVIQFLLIGLLGAFLASGYSNILSPNARRDINKVAFYVFAPSLVFSSLAKSVTLKGLISWWFMPVNMAMIYLIGGTIGWIAVKILRPGKHLEGLVISCCSAANLGYLVLILVPAICNEAASPFGDVTSCRTRGLSYVSLSMSLGSIYTWTYTYRVMRKSGDLYNKMRRESSLTDSNGREALVQPSLNTTANAAGAEKGNSHLDEVSSNEDVLVQTSIKSTNNSVIDGKETRSEGKMVSDEDHVIAIGRHSKSEQEIAEDQKITEQLSSTRITKKKNFRDRFKGLTKTLEELFAPPTIAAIIGLFVGAIPWLKKLIIGTSAPLRVIEETISTLGNALLACTILILGGNLTQGVRKSTLKPIVIVLVIFVRYVLLPIAGIGIVKAAGHLGLLPHDPLFRYVLMIQFALPPAMSIGTMAQLFDVAKEECSVIFLWTYLVAILALTIWPTVFMSILS